MLLAELRFKNINIGALGAALLLYLAGIFGTKVLQPGIIAVVGAGFFCLFHVPYFLRKPQAAALLWLVPAVISGLYYNRLIEKEPGGQNLAYFLTALIISLVPFVLLITATAGQKEQGPKKQKVIKARIIVQIVLLLVYLTVTAIAWIHGRRVDLFYWGMFHVFATAFLPFLFGRVLCSWICPNATIQDGVYRHLCYKRPVAKLPQCIDEQSHTAAMSIKGAVDASAPYIPATMLIPWFIFFLMENSFDITGMMEYSIFFMYGVIVLSFLFPWRKFCTHFCWIAGYKTLVGHNSLLRLKFNRSRCRKCMPCKAEIACPMHIDISRLEQEMPATCCLCFDCKQACPFGDVIGYPFSWKRMRLRLKKQSVGPLQ